MKGNRTLSVILAATPGCRDVPSCVNKPAASIFLGGPTARWLRRHDGDGIAPRTLAGAAAQRAELHPRNRAGNGRRQLHQPRPGELGPFRPRLAAIRARANLIHPAVQHGLAAHRQLPADIVQQGKESKACPSRPEVRLVLTTSKPVDKRASRSWRASPWQ